MTISEKIAAKAKRDGAVPDASQFDMAADPEFTAKLEEKRALDAIKKWTEARLKELSAEIEIVLIAEEAVDGMRWDGCLVKQGRGRTGDKVSTTRLVELGVPIDTIAAATEEGRAYTFAQIVVPKDRQQKFETWEQVREYAERFGFGEEAA